MAACGAGVHGMGSVRAYGELRTALRGAPATAAAAAAAAGSCIAASAASAAPWPTITHTAILWLNSPSNAQKWILVLAIINLLFLM